MSAFEWSLATTAVLLLTLAVVAGGTWWGVLAPLPVLGIAVAFLWQAKQKQSGQLSPWVANFEFLMSYLDRLTDREKLHSLLTQKPVSPHARSIDVDAVRSALQKAIIGNNAVIDDIVHQVSVRFLKEKSSGPIGVFMLAGPPSTGKTTFGVALGQALFGEGGYETVDMADFSSSSSASTLVGSSPGLAGSGEMARFIQRLAANPAMVVVLDEFEKAHPEVQQRFLAAWTRGEITEMTKGRKISTRQTIFIVTTNAAQNELADAARTFTGDRRLLSDQCKVILRQHFSEALLSRINYVFPLMPLEGMELAELVAKLVEECVQSYGMTLHNISPETLVNYVTEASQRGMDARATQNQIERDIAQSLTQLRKEEIRDVIIYERGGQVMVNKYVPPAQKAASKPKAK